MVLPKILVLMLTHGSAGEGVLEAILHGVTIAGVHAVALPACSGSGAILVLGYWVGVRRPVHLSLFLTAPRMVLPQYPSTHPQVSCQVIMPWMML